MLVAACLLFALDTRASVFAAGCSITPPHEAMPWRRLDV